MKGGLKKKERIWKMSKELGHDRAVEEAKKYASELCSKYKTDWEWY
jgi:hypothetical protein